MALVSKSKAAKLAGVSRTTIHRYIKTGKLSATGGEIETSELIRVFGTIRDESLGTPETVAPEQPVTPPELPHLTTRIRDLENQLQEVKQDRDIWREQAQANQRLLEDKSGQDRVNRTDHFMMVGLIGAILTISLIIWFSQA
jgi:hypothetical protein